MHHILYVEWCEAFPSWSAALMPPPRLLSFCFMNNIACRKSILCVRCLDCTSTLTWMVTRRTAWWGADFNLNTKSSDLFSLTRYCSINHYPCVLYDHECTGRSSKFGGNVWSKSWILSPSYSCMSLERFLTWYFTLRWMICSSVTGWRTSLLWWKTSQTGLLSW